MWFRRWVGLDQGPLDEVSSFANYGEWPNWRSLYAVASGELLSVEWLDTMLSMPPSTRPALVEDFVKNTWWITELGRLRPLDFREKNTYCGQLIVMLAEWIAPTDEGQLWAKDVAKKLLSQDRSDPVESLVSVVTLGLVARQRGRWLERRYEQLVDLDVAPVSTYPPAIAKALDTLEPSRLEALIDRLPLHRVSTTSEKKTDQETDEVLEYVEASYIYFLPTWDLLELISHEAVLTRVLDELVAYEAHVEQHAHRRERLRFGSRDEPFPREVALRCFASRGTTARQIVESYRNRIRDESFIEAALALLGD